MSKILDPDTARLRHDEAVVDLRNATKRLIGMCKLTLLDVESIQDQACVVCALVNAERDTRAQLAGAETNDAS